MKRTRKSKLVKPSLSLLALASLSGLSYAALLSLGVSFIGRNNDQLLGPDVTAGVFTQADWNNLGNNLANEPTGNFSDTPINQTSSNLFADDGLAGTRAATGITLTASANDSWNADGPTNTGNDKLMKGIIKSNGAGPTTTVVLNGLTPGTRYNFLAYGQENGGTGDVNFSLAGAATYSTYFVRQSNNFDGTFTLGNSTDSANRSQGVDYVQWNAVQADATGHLTLTMFYAGNGSDGAGLAGIQLLELPPLPGPNKFWNFGAGTSTWDLTSNNWQDASNATAKYVENDSANFDDRGAAGARIVNISNGGNGVSPGAVIVNNSASNPYTISGEPIKGFTGLTKDGVGALTMSGANTFTGGVTIKHGTVNATTIGDATTAGNLGQGTTIAMGDTAGANDAVLNYTGVTASAVRAVSVAGNGAAINVPAAVTLTLGNLSGAGTLFTKGGAGNLTFGGTLGTFTGGLAIPQGTLSVANLGVGAAGTGISAGTTGAAGFTLSGPVKIKDARTLTVGANPVTLTVSNSEGLLRLAGATATSAGNLIIGGPGRVIVDGAANFSVLPTIQAGGTLSLKATSGNTLPAGTVNIPSGTLGLAAPGTYSNATAFNLSGGTLRIGAEGLTGQYFPGGADQSALNGTLFSVVDYFGSQTQGAVSGIPTTTAGRVDLDFNNGNGGANPPFGDQGVTDADNIRAFFTGKILISTAGVTGFQTTSDDGSAIFIDGQRVVANNFFQGMTARSGTANLSAGLHDIQIYYYEGGGGAGLIASYQPVGAAGFTPIPNSVLFTNDAYSAPGVPITVSQNSAIDVGALTSSLGALNLTPAKTLTVTGTANFAGTTLAAGTGNYGINVANVLGNVNLGALTGAAGKAIDKSGPGALVVSNSGSATINVNAGLLVDKGSETGGTTTDPLAGVTVNFADGSGLGLTASGGNPNYTRALPSNGNFRLEVGGFGAIPPLASNITYTPAALAVDAGKTLSVAVDSAAYSLAVATPVTGAGSLSLEQGKISFTSAAGVTAPQGITVATAQVSVTGPITTGALALTNSLNGITPTTGTQQSSLTASGAVNTSSVAVTAGTLSVGGVLTNTGALNLTGGTTTLTGNASNASISVTNSTLNAGGNLSSTGAFNVNGGGNATVTGTTTAGSIAVTGGGTLTAKNNVTTTTGTTVGDNSTLVVNGNSTFAGALTLGNTSTFRVQSGTTNLGTAPMNFPALVVTPGLLEGVITNSTNVDSIPPNPGTGKTGVTGGVRLFPRLGETNTKNADLWGDNETWVYTGEFKDADGIFAFGENIDDDTRVFIDGNLALSSGCCSESKSSLNNAGASNNFGMGPNGDGWHKIEIRFHNGGGGAGADPTGNNWGGGDAASFAKKGFGLNTGDTSSVSGVDYNIPTDPGNATLFRVVTGGGTIQVDSGATLQLASTTNSRSINLNGTAGAGAATFKLADAAAATASAGNVISIRGGTGVGVLTIGTNDTLTVGALIGLDGGSITKNGPGALVINGQVAEQIGVSATSDLAGANLTITDGLLRLNAVTTGSGVAFVKTTGTLAGTGTLAQPLFAQSGGTIAPGNNGIGTLNLASGLNMSSGSILKLELDATSSDVLNVLSNVSLGNATLQLNVLATPTLGQVYYIVLNDDSDADSVLGTFTGIADGGSITANGIKFDVSYDANSLAGPAGFTTGGNDVALKVSAVPEPNTAVTLLGATALLLGVSRRRRRSA